MVSVPHSRSLVSKVLCVLSGSMNKPPLLPQYSSSVSSCLQLYKGKVTHATEKKKKGSPTNLSPSFFSGHHLNTHTPLIEGIRQGLLLAFSPQNFFVGACLPFVSLSRPTSLYHKFFSYYIFLVF